MTNSYFWRAPAVTSGLIKLPIKAAWFAAKHPVLCALLALILIWSSIMTLALFNPAIAERFNNAMRHFGYATAASMASDRTREQLKTAKSRLKAKARELASTRRELRASEGRATTANKRIIELRGINSRLEQKGLALERDLDATSRALDDSRKQLDSANKKVREQAQRLNEFDTKHRRFARTGKNIERRLNGRFAKIALYDSAGEILGILPVVGDAASIGFTISGLREMCLMFMEIEKATKQLGVPYMVYSGTLCDNPGDKTKKVVAEATIELNSSIPRLWGNMLDYWKYKTEEFGYRYRERCLKRELLWCQ